MTILHHRRARGPECSPFRTTAAVATGHWLIPGGLALVGWWLDGVELPDASFRVVVGVFAGLAVVVDVFRALRRALVSRWEMMRLMGPLHRPRIGETERIALVMPSE